MGERGILIEKWKLELNRLKIKKGFFKNLEE